MSTFYQTYPYSSLARRTALTGIFFTGFILQQLTATAQDSARVKNLEEVVVTATKFPKKISQTGKVVRVITAVEIERSRGKTLSELLNEQAGIIVIGSNSNPGKDKSLSLRGAGAGYTLVLLDGVPLTDPSDGQGVFDLRLLNLEQIERIEILKGGQSTLYGSDAVAGVINLISKLPGKKALNIGATLTAGSMGAKRTGLELSGRIVKALSYTASFGHFQTDGIPEATDNKTDSANTGHFHRNGYSQNALMAKLVFSPDASLKISPYFRFTANRGTYPADAFMDGAYTYKLRSMTGGITGSYIFPASGTLYFNDAYTYTQRSFNSAYGPYAYTGRFNQAEIYYTQQLGSHMQFIGGLSHQYEGTLDSVSKFKQASLSMISPYASFFIKNLAGFNLDLGGRLNHHSTYGNNLTWNINPSYTFFKEVKVFAGAASAFKAPTITELFGAFGANKSLKPETSYSYETGISFFASHTFSLDAVIFRRSIRNEITYYNNRYENQSRQNDKGLEIEPNWNPVSGLNIKTFFAYVDGKVTTRLPSGRDTSYYNLIRRPKYSIGIFAGYQIRQSYISLNFRSYQHRFDQNFADYTKIDLVNLKGYSQLDAYLEQNFFNKRLKVFAQLFNILNRSYTEVYGYNTLRFHTEIGIHLSL